WRRGGGVPKVGTIHVDGPGSDAFRAFRHGVCCADDTKRDLSAVEFHAGPALTGGGGTRRWTFREGTTGRPVPVGGTPWSAAIRWKNSGRPFDGARAWGSS